MSIWVECDEHGETKSALYANTDSIILCTTGDIPGAEMLLFLSKIVEGGGIENIDCDDASFAVLKNLFPEAETEIAVQMCCENRIDTVKTEDEIKNSENISDVSALMSAAFGKKEKSELDLWYLRMARAVLRGQTTMFTLHKDGKAVSTASIRGRTASAGAITSVVTLPEYRGKGFSKLLMEYVLDKAKERGAETVLLEVRASNAAAIGLYEKYGFSQIGMRKGYYSFPKEDAVLMCRVENAPRRNNLFV
jgi:ribosomal-protein-alanine acetyltransferase